MDLEAQVHRQVHKKVPTQLDKIEQRLGNVEETLKTILDKGDLMEENLQEKMDQIQEEIENDLPSLFEQFESEEDRRSRYVDILTNNDPNDDSDVPEDFRKGFNLIKKTS